MADVILFHHALGLTPGVTAFEDILRDAGHTVYTRDLFDGKTFATIADGVGYAGEVGFGDGWPGTVPVQIHRMDADPYFVDEGDIDAAREIVSSTDGGELFTYPGDRHCFADSTQPSYDPDAATLLMARVLAFLDRNG